MIFYYSGCGNSRWLATELATRLDDGLRFIPDLLRAGTDSYDIRQDESIGFVFPVYAWAAPKLVQDFVTSVKWNGHASYVWFACTCGDEMGMTCRTFSKTLRKSGLVPDAAFCVQMPETYLCFPGFHLDSPESESLKLENAARKVNSIAARIAAKAKAKDLIIGTFPLFKSYIIKPLFIRNVTDSKYHVNDDCISCGLCAKVCPLHNIEMAGGKPSWQGNCTQCMACYQYCPRNAIHFATYTKDKGQYHFPDSNKT